MTKIWKIRDQMPDGSLGLEYAVTPAQFCAARREKAEKAKAQLEAMAILLEARPRLLLTAKRKSCAK